MIEKCLFYTRSGVSDNYWAVFYEGPVTKASNYMVSRYLPMQSIYNDVPTFIFDGRQLNAAANYPNISNFNESVLLYSSIFLIFISTVVLFIYNALHCFKTVFTV